MCVGVISDSGGHLVSLRYTAPVALNAEASTFRVRLA